MTAFKRHQEKGSTGGEREDAVPLLLLGKKELIMLTGPLTMAMVERAISAVRSNEACVTAWWQIGQFDTS
jgi:hypothetical protein